MFLACIRVVWIEATVIDFRCIANPITSQGVVIWKPTILEPDHFTLALYSHWASSLEGG